MKNNSEYERQRVREALYQAFASEGRDREQCQKLTSRYDQLTENGMSTSGAAGIIYSAYGQTDARQMLNKISSFIFSELETFNAKNSVDINPLTRIRRAAKTINDNLKRVCHISINGVDVSQEMLEKASIRLPPCLSSPTIYEARASENKPTKLVLEVIF